jgi:hypothetical protein
MTDTSQPGAAAPAQQQAQPQVTPQAQPQAAPAQAQPPAQTPPAQRPAPPLSAPRQQEAKKVGERPSLIQAPGATPAQDTVAAAMAASEQARLQAAQDEHDATFDGIVSDQTMAEMQAGKDAVDKHKARRRADRA